MAYLAFSAISRFTARLLMRLSLMVGLMVGMTACISGPPVQEMSNARQAIKAAVDAGAARSAARELTEAQQLLQRAESRLEGQAYRDARVSAVAAHGKAKKALSIAQATVSQSTTPK